MSENEAKEKEVTSTVTVSTEAMETVYKSLQASLMLANSLTSHKREDRDRHDVRVDKLKSALFLTAKLLGADIDLNLDETAMKIKEALDGIS